MKSPRAVIALIGIDDIIGSELPTTYQAAGLTVRIESVVNALTDVEYVRQGVGRFPTFRQLPGESKQRNVRPVEGEFFPSKSPVRPGEILIDTAYEVRPAAPPTTKGSLVSYSMTYG